MDWYKAAHYCSGFGAGLVAGTYCSDPMAAVIMGLFITVGGLLMLVFAVFHGDDT